MSDSMVLLAIHRAAGPSLGVYGFPADQAARLAVTTLMATPSRLELVRLVAFDAATHRLLAEAHAASA